MNERPHVQTLKCFETDLFANTPENTEKAALQHSSNNKGQKNTEVLCCVECVVVLILDFWWLPLTPGQTEKIL